MRAAHLMAIVNEALANIVRHANARNVKIQVRDLGERLHLAIKDDGIGINPDSQPGYGLSNMRDRARLLRGTLEFSNPNNKGTLVSLEIPWVD
jgi:two-component system nitrate/nitrite sensor histidine kinase NarQ